MSKPRTVYSPPRNSFSKIGSVVVSRTGAMNCNCPRTPNEVRDVCRQNLIASDGRLVELRVAAEHRQVDRQREPLAGVREDRVVDRVVHEARDHLAHRAAAARANQQRIENERVPLQARQRVLGQLRQVVELTVAQPLTRLRRRTDRGTPRSGRPS